jgi:hypothetical protein
VRPEKFIGLLQFDISPRICPAVPDFLPQILEKPPAATRYRQHRIVITVVVSIGSARMRFVILPLWLLLSLLFTIEGAAQSTISDRPFELVAGNGAWFSWLPTYELGADASGFPALQDDMDDVGYYGDLKAIRRFLGTRTSLEARGFYGFSETNTTTEVLDANVPNPIDGAANLLTGGSLSLASDTDHYGIDVGLRDTWRTRFGGLSGGCLFSFMEFDQDFDVEYGSLGLLSESLDSEYLGGKGVVGWDGRFWGSPSNLDIAVGFYQLRADYRYRGEQIPGSFATTMHKTPVTVETIFSSYRDIHRYRLGLTIAATYIAQMPVIEHEANVPVSLGTDSGAMLRLMVEILL